MEYVPVYANAAQNPGEVRISARRVRDLGVETALVDALLTVPCAATARGMSMFGASFIYVILGAEKTLADMRAPQDWYLRYALSRARGVAEVAHISISRGPSATKCVCPRALISSGAGGLNTCSARRCSSKSSYR